MVFAGFQAAIGDERSVLLSRKRRPTRILRKIVMTEHHRFGPSQLEHYDPRTRAGKRGCYAFVPGEALSTQDAEAGSLKHQAAAARDLSLLEGDLAAIEEVK